MPTVLHRLVQWSESTPNAPAQRTKSRGEWRTLSAKDFADRVYHLALFLQARGLTAADSGAIFSYNCPQWVQMDLATLLLGAKSAGLYPNSTAKDIAYILNHAEAAAVAVQNKDYFKRMVDEKGQSLIPDRVKLLLVFEGDASFSPKAVSFEAALAEGKRLASAKGCTSLNQFLSRINPTASAFMIYTSGTTGNPKGALLSHDNLVYTSDMVARYWNLPMAHGSLFSFLPLCHVAEKLQNVGVGISRRYAVNYCTKFENVIAEMVEVQPSLLLCVPRLWEKMMEGVLSKLRLAKGAKQKMAYWALGVGARVAEAKYAGRSANPLDLVQWAIAKRLVIQKLRHALGLGKAELLASGAAALAPHVAKWFRSLGLEILEDFGQTESTGVICMTEPGVESAGTVGKPLPGVEFKIADDGEVLTRGRHVFIGYHKDDAATAQTLEGGWLHTGDLAEVNSRGLVQVRGRKKEILKTSGGKMVAPLPIEEKLKAAEVISQVCMVGDGRKYLSALITLTEPVLASLQRGNGGGGAGEGAGGRVSSNTLVVTDPKILEPVKKHIDEVNRSLASYEQIKRFTVLSREFSIADGEMTPTLKMKRNIIETHFKDLINGMYTT